MGQGRNIDPKYWGPFLNHSREVDSQLIETAVYTMELCEAVFERGP